MPVSTVQSGVDASSETVEDVLFEAWIEYASKIRRALARPLRDKQKPGMPLRSVVANIGDDDPSDFVADVVRAVVETARQATDTKNKKFSCVILGEKGPNDKQPPVLADPVVIEIAASTERLERETEMVSVLRLLRSQNADKHTEYIALLKATNGLVAKLATVESASAKQAKWEYKKARFQFDREATLQENIDSNAHRAAASKRWHSLLKEMFGNDSTFLETLGQFVNMWSSKGGGANPSAPTDEEIKACTVGLDPDLGKLIAAIRDCKDKAERDELCRKLSDLWDNTSVEDKQRLMQQTLTVCGQVRGAAILHWIKGLGVK